MRANLQVRSISQVAHPADPGQVLQALLEEHQKQIADQLKALPVGKDGRDGMPGRDGPVGKDGPPGKDGHSFDLEALREILTLHQMQLADAVRVLQTASEASARATQELTAAIRARGRIQGMNISYDAEGRIVDVAPQYAPI